MDSEPDTVLDVPEQRPSSSTDVALLKKRNRTLLLLNRAGQVLTATLEVQQILERLLQVAIEIIGAEGSSVWLWDEQEPNRLVCRAAFHKSHDNIAMIGQCLDAGQGIAGWIAQTGESAIVNQVDKDERFSPHVDAQSGFTTRSLLAVPLRLRNINTGVLEVVNKSKGNFNEDDQSVAETLAAFASTALYNARLVEKLREQASDLQARNEELDAFAHTVAHDLQNPLALLVGFADILQRNGSTINEVERQEVLHMLTSNVLKMSNIVQELLLLASVRKTDVELQPLDMDRIVASALKRLSYLIEEHDADIIRPFIWPASLGYAPWVEEVWENYLSNAIKYGGKPPHVEMGSEVQADGMIRFWVSDNGSGLSPEAQSKLFIPFTKLGEIRATGHGLGLSIVQRIVEKLGGQVAVESEVGQGSTFSFTLPAVASEMGD
jgi:signal transduction histidine kinase